MRALVIHWSDIVFHGDGSWSQAFDFITTGPGLKAQFNEIVMLGDNDSQAQIKAKVAAAVRARVMAEWGQTVENNQVIFPDSTRG